MKRRVAAVAVAAALALPAAAAPGDRTTRLISPAGAGPSNAVFVGAPPDGSRVWYLTAEPNVALGDTDAGFDIYERHVDGGLRLITEPGAGSFNVNPGLASVDGSRVLFSTTEPNAVLGDTDANWDVYERGANGSLRLISLPGAGAFDAVLAGMSEDGARAWFFTIEPNPPEGDTGAAIDVYDQGFAGRSLVPLRPRRGAGKPACGIRAGADVTCGRAA